jgi:CYTH domain-containing protein
MSVEIERRFLVSDPRIVEGASREIIIQGYFFVKNGYAARIRRIHQVGDEHVEGHRLGPGHAGQGRATLAVKGPRLGVSRDEFEMEIDPGFAEAMLREIEYKISKSRYHIVAEGETWDVDVFHGDNEGLVIAECEMEKSYVIKTPRWCTEEITDKREYDNENLAVRPYKTWRT